MRARPTPSTQKRRALAAHCPCTETGLGVAGWAQLLQPWWRGAGCCSMPGALGALRRGPALCCRLVLSVQPTARPQHGLCTSCTSSGAPGSGCSRGSVPGPSPEDAQCRGQGQAGSCTGGPAAWALPADTVGRSRRTDPGACVAERVQARAPEPPRPCTPHAGPRTSQLFNATLINRLGDGGGLALEFLGPWGERGSTGPGHERAAPMACLHGGEIRRETQSDGPGDITPSRAARATGSARPFPPPRASS